MKEHKKVQNLIKKYLSGQCTPEEAAAVEKWYAIYLNQNESTYKAIDLTKAKEAVWKEISRQRPSKVKKLKKWPSIVAASAVIVALLAFYQFVLTPTFKDKEKLAQEETTIIPSSSNAVLTTADGRRIALSLPAPGVLEQGEGFEITKEADGLIVFDVTTRDVSTPTAYNVVETPKGGIYQVVLPDGSKAWLNNASSISFPTQFAANERLVKVTGEIYFEVEHDSQRPFKVAAPQQEIEVLGTKFNVNAYKDEPLAKTTLIEGSVKVKGQSSAQVLRPGDQMTTETGTHDRISAANLSAVLAWKEGVFHFERVNLEVLMRQIARWYDVELVYEGKLPQDEFVGEIKRSEDIKHVLEILQDGQIDISLEGRKLIVGRKK